MRGKQSQMIIGLTGLAGSGKSEVAAALRELGQFHRIPFAGPLKTMLSSVGFSDAQLWGDEKEVPVPELGGVTPRHLMQTLGTEWGRNTIHPDIWVTLWERAVEARSGHVVVDDVRFPNEVDIVRSLGGQVWRIERPGVATMNHASETQIASLEVDSVIQNTGDLFHLRQAAAGLLATALRDPPCV